MGIFDKIMKALHDAFKKSAGPYIQKNGLKIPVRKKTPIELIIDKLNFETID